jgi:hypothetical protein
VERLLCHVRELKVQHQVFRGFCSPIRESAASRLGSTGKLTFAPLSYVFPQLSLSPSPRADCAFLKKLQTVGAIYVQVDDAIAIVIRRPEQQVGKFAKRASDNASCGNGLGRRDA